mmetsp:Transcript_3550/g.3948  ORF Transcript_3550/g.3948 Transcript_3550/m.3948 type:complete len:82 (-) Transcript_3550:55-300(-)
MTVKMCLSGDTADAKCCEDDNQHSRIQAAAAMDKKSILIHDSYSFHPILLSLLISFSSQKICYDANPLKIIRQLILRLARK